MVALLSAFRCYSAPLLRRCWLVLALLGLIAFFFPKRERIHFLKWKCPSYGFLTGILLALAITMFLIQVGKANGALDYDSIWYGLWPESVPANSSEGIFEDLGIIACVYTFPKGFEILTLPLSGVESYSFLFGLNLWIGVLLIGSMYTMSSPDEQAVTLFYEQVAFQE